MGTRTVISEPKVDPGQVRVASATAAPRKGATSRASVTTEIRAALNAGTLETRSLSETLVVDFDALLLAIGRAGPPLATTGIVKRMAEAGSRLPAMAVGGGGLKVTGAGQGFVAHGSDTVRGWAAYALARDLANIADLLAAVRPLACDPHFGVREWAWMAVRPTVAAQLDAALAVLAGWATDPDANARRFASEVTRPRGVWCGHIDALKANPSLGVPVLDPLFADPSKYVRDSVGNWLNDAGKSDPGFVRAVTARWTELSSSPETAYIVKRGMRSLAR
jgi:3-methyladenine DNA glycosylase AlkC